jgi:amino acid transporter
LDATHVKTLGRRDLVLFTVSAILLLDTLAAGAATGPPAVFWWLFLGVVYFLPYALICAELGTALPVQGGLYVWVREAFGRRWASRATWNYWVNNAVWMPSIYILFAGIFSQMFAPDMSFGTQIGIAIALTWLAVAINIVALDIGKWIPNVGAIIKVVVICALVVGAVVFVQRHDLASPITLETMLPARDGIIQYLPVIIYGMLGFELVSGTIIIVLYTLATTAIIAALPPGEINLVEGLVDTLRRFFGGTAAGDAFVMLLGIGALYTFFANGVTWALGCNRSMAEAAVEGEFPAAMGRQHARFGTPVGAAVGMGGVSTFLLLLYGLFAKNNEELFWSLFSFSAVILLLPMIGLVCAFAKLRRTMPDLHRPYRVPGGGPVATVLVCTCLAVLVLAILLFMFVPGDGIQWPVVLGTAGVVAVGEIVIRMAEHKMSSLSNLASTDTVTPRQ